MLSSMRVVCFFGPDASLCFSESGIFVINFKCQECLTAIRAAAKRSTSQGPSRASCTKTTPMCTATPS